MTRVASFGGPCGFALGMAVLVAVAPARGQVVPVDRSGYHPSREIKADVEGDRLLVTWLMEGEYGRLVLDRRAGRPLVDQLQIPASFPGVPPVVLAERVDPVFYLTVGTRSAPPGRPPGMSDFNVFFDSPAERPHRTYRSRLDLRRIRVTSQGRRASVAVGDLELGPFRGELVVTVYAGSRLLQVEAVVRTEEDRRAILYDAGLVSEAPGWRRLVWFDTEGGLQSAPLDATQADRPLAVRHRALVAESAAGALACFPPPHQYFFPRDLTTNPRVVWFGRGHERTNDPPGFGIRQDREGGGRFVPWFNAPPGTDQRLSVFYLLGRGSANDLLWRVLRLTHNDRFVPLPGTVTFTSHWHMAIALAAMQETSNPNAPRTVPDFVRMFKEMGVNAVHLGEFHGDGHPKDPGPLRLPELDAMFAECRRLSDAQLLVLPGEEINEFLGLPAPGRHPGHWMSLFPKPVYWTMQRSAGQPFAEPDRTRGTVYHVGSRADMVRLIEREHGLAWTSHPRIKASSWTPDIFRDEDFYRADFWVGAAWKAMPADLSSPRLGQRALDLLDDMANWGGRKHLLGEVDVFKIDHTHELYGHMNINYLRLDRLPRFEDGWQPILDALRAGRFFTTTGEVLIREFSVGGEPAELKADLEWTFPLRFAEVISGDGRHVERQRIDLSDTGAFGRRTLTVRPDLSGRRWVRFEVWDVAANGAFTQPVWLDGPSHSPP